jgi:hypothetical protein
MLDGSIRVGESSIDVWPRLLAVEVLGFAKHDLTNARHWAVEVKRIAGL